MQTTVKNNKKKSQNRTTNGSFGGAFPRLDEIAARAHEIYLARGGEAGHELDDWLQAEREIMEWV